MGRQLRLDTALGNPVANEQGEGTYTAGDLMQFGALERSYGSAPDFQIRSGATPIYNCHGLAFASRRTAIYDNSSIFQMLKEDGYKEVETSAVLPGDLLVYFDEKGQPEHSAIVVSTNREIGMIFMPVVVSKWGTYKEIIHLANRCPYNLGHAKYYRVKK